LIVCHEGKYIPVPSEGGHTDFPLNNKSHIGLWHHLKKRYDHVSIERIVSGPGIFNIYTWLKDSGQHKEPKWLSEKLNSDPARIIAETALTRNQPLCKKTLNLFVSFFGYAAGNLALAGMTRGGVYLGGGIPPKILPLLKGDIFLNSFRDKGRFRALLEKIPVYVILNQKTPLLGAAIAASED
jgi:glucokinase